MEKQGIMGAIKRYFVMIILLGFISSVNVSCKSKSKTVKVNTYDIKFIDNKNELLGEVIERSEKTGKIIFVDFHADWCLPCKILDEEVFNQREVHQFFNKNFINYKVDIEKSNGANLKLMYGAEDLPTLLFLDNKGRVLSRNNGPVTHTSLMTLAKKAIKNQGMMTE